MRRNPNIIRRKPSIKPQPALLGGDLPETIQHPAVRHFPIRAPTLPLQSRLDEIKRQTEETGEKPGDATGRQRLRPGPPLRMLLQLHLRLAEKRQLPEIQRHRAGDRRQRPGPQRGHAFGFGDAREGVDDAAVVGALRRRLQPIALHADEGQIGGIPNHGGQAAGGQTRGGAFLEADGSAGGVGSGGEGVHEGVEEAEAGGGVDGLAQEAGGEARVQVQEFAVGDDVAGDLDGAGPGGGAGAGAGELEADFDHVDGLDDGCGGHAGEAAVEEGEGESDGGVLQEGAGFVGGLFGDFGRGRRFRHGGRDGWRVGGALLEREGREVSEGCVDLYSRAIWLACLCGVEWRVLC